MSATRDPGHGNAAWELKERYHGDVLAGPDVLILILQPASRQDGGGSPGQDESPAS